MAHLGKENVANLQQCQEAANDVKVKITSDGLKRMPCERPRCVARRQAINGFKRASSTAWLRLTLYAWKQYSGTTPMERAARHVIRMNAQRQKLRSAFQQWQEHSPSLGSDTAALAEQCIAAATLALCKSALGAEDTGATAEELHDHVQSSVPESQQQAYLEYEEAPQPALPAVGAAEVPEAAVAATPSYKPYGGTPQRLSASSSSSQPSVLRSSTYPPLPTQSPRQRAVPQSRLLRVDAEKLVSAVSGALQQLAALIAEEWAASGDSSAIGASRTSLLRRCGATALSVASSVSTSAPVSPLLRTALLKRRTAPRNLMDAYRNSGFRDA